MDGIITFGSPAENQIRITFDDQKTDAEKIAQALVQGGVAIPGKPTPGVRKTPFTYKVILSGPLVFEESPRPSGRPATGRGGR